MLDLGGNRLTGSIPANLGNPLSMRWLGLNENRLSGEIPGHLSSLTHLELLNLSFNRLEGEIPWSLTRLVNLDGLHLGDNRLTGCIPSALTDVRLNDFEWFTLPICAEPPEEEVDLAPVIGAGLAQDADLLLAIRDELAGEASLNWSIGVPVDEWDGVTLSGAPLRVTEIDLEGLRLTGSVPAGLGSLDELRVLKLGSGFPIIEIPCAKRKGIRQTRTVSPSQSVDR